MAVVGTCSSAASAARLLVRSMLPLLEQKELWEEPPRLIMA